MASLITGLKAFIGAMQSTPWSTTVWASLFPFPQLLLGGALGLSRGFSSPAGVYCLTRAISFLIAGQVQLRAPLSKAMGPIMHLPFLIAVPVGVRWLQSHDMADDPVMSSFVAYTTVVTCVSLCLDGVTAVKWISGKDVGTFKTDPANNGAFKRMWLPVPSLVLAAVAFLVWGKAPLAPPTRP
eukprot:INCI16323.2.p1 GENE.INCI16323.2~~INCI16323.2.p1  ORF type:complete len:183 (+),score=13.49 INCI16323.2:203-751(+)